MRGYGLIPAAFLLTAGCGGPRWALHRSPKLGVTKYTVSRTWEADPPDSGNGNQRHTMTAVVEPLSTTVLRVEVLDFKGEVVGDPRGTKLLKDMRPQILRLVLERRVGRSGPASALDVVGGNGAGWAGMMVMKTLGMYEFGLTDFVYPRQPVGPGDTWTTSFDVLQEEEFGANLDAQSGGPSHKAVFRDRFAKVLFRLESVAKVAGCEQARVGYRFDQEATFTYRSIGDSAMHEATVAWTQTGEFWVDVATGLVEAFSADRSVEMNYGTERTKEHTVTDARIQ